MHRMYRSVVIVVIALVALSLVGTAGAQTVAPSVQRTAQGAQTPEELCAQAAQAVMEPETRTFSQAEDVLEDGVDYWAVMCTAQGPIVLDLLETESPLTVNNFVFLAQQGYYNNITFHRVLPGFMLQGGDPTGTGSGGPGYQFGDETSNGLTFDRGGLLAMANAGPGTNGSQFFITYTATSWLDGNHTIFGRVVQGIEAAELATPRDPQQGPTFDGDALQTVVIVDDPAALTVTPDGPPDLDHFQAMLDKIIASQINPMFSVAEDYSHVYTLDEEAESWADQGGQAMVDYMRGYLAERGFLGTAALLMLVGECPANTAESPIWGVGFQVADYGAAGAAEAVVFDNARADTFLDTGAYESYSDTSDGTGRIFRLPTGEWCGPTGVYYRLEYPVGRYILTADVVVEGAVIGDSTEPTGEQFALYVLSDLFYAPLVGTLERGNAAVE